MVTGDKVIFTEWAKSRDGVAPLYRKPMIHYDKLVEIWPREVKLRVRETNLMMDEDQSILNETQFGSQDVDESTSQTRGTNTTPGTSRQSLKRKSCEIDTLESEFIQISKSITSLLEAEKESALAMNDIKKAFLHEVDVHEQTCDKRNQLFQVLSTLPDLIPEQVVKVTRLIDQDVAKMELFFTMPDDYKVIFARQEIDGPN